MRHARAFIPFIIAAVVLISSCGGGGGLDLTKPFLDIGDITSIVVDQFYINGGMEDEYGGQGEFSVYMRDSATGKDVACTTQEDGMKALASSGVYYGELSVPFKEIEGVSIDSVARFKLVFVEKDGGECPEPIGIEDDIAGESAELTTDDLLANLIWATNGRAAAVLRDPGKEPLAVLSMAPALNEGLFIDKLFFEHDAPEGSAPRFYISADVGDDLCQIGDEFMDSIRTGDVLYAALGFSIPCLDAADRSFTDMEMSLSLFVQEDSGPELIGEIEPARISDLIGERADFTNGKGYVSFQSMSPVYFGAPVVRLADLAATQITKVSHSAAPQTAGVVEVFAVDPVSGKYLACAGAGQGLAAIEQAGAYEGLAATLSSAGWEREIFGYGSVYFALIERSDALSCPTLPGEGMPVLARTAVLSPAELATGAVNFEENGGSIEFAAAPAN